MEVPGSVLNVEGRPMNRFSLRKGGPPTIGLSEEHLCTQLCGFFISHLYRLQSQQKMPTKGKVNNKVKNTYV